MARSDPSDSNSKAGRGSFSLKRLIPLAVLAVGCAAFFALGLHRHFNFETLQQNRAELLEWVAGNRVWSAIVFTAVYAVAVGFSLPGGALMTITGGFLFGPVLATLCVLVGATVGATALFLAARTALGDVLRRKAGGAIARMAKGFRRDALSYLLFLRLIPLFPFWLVNLVPAFLGVGLNVFVLGTFFGIIPGTIVYVLVGNGLGAVLDAGNMPEIDLIFEPEILLPFLGLAVLALLPVIYKRFKGRRS